VATAVVEVHGELTVRKLGTAALKLSVQAYRLALARLRLGASECLAFEDSDVGVASAIAAGIDVIRVNFAE
jgi:HAD superfamily hydrolase (TIGR01509 family)